MLKSQTKQYLKHKKNLLAFSAGGDSTALLFLLLQNDIKFDIAIVDYKIRQQSKKEVEYAKELAKKYNLQCFVHEAQIIDSNFEAKAREIRYDFFNTLIDKYNYEVLMTAHHLGDRFEWMLMQFCKGAGCVELSGMQEIDKRSNYTLYRPVLHLEKEELLAYLTNKNIKYFEDQSNFDEKYKRNYFRQNHTKPLLKKYLNGIKKSFSYIDEDRISLIKNIEIKEINNLAYFQNPDDKRSSIYHIDKYLKMKGDVISAKERELLKKNNSIVLSRKYIVSFSKNYVFIAPFLKNIKMSKKFKEKMRRLKVDPKLRTYLASDDEAEVVLSSLL